MRLNDWGKFWLLGLLWGSSFLWIKIGLRGTGPFMLVALRLAVGVVGLGIVVFMRKPNFSATPSLVGKLVLLGAFNTAIPFLLITWGEKSIDSALASILNGTMPLFTILLSHFFLADERITVPKFLGLIVGFGGVVLLLGGGSEKEELRGSFVGQMAVLIAAFSYASSLVFTRRTLRQVSPLIQAFVPLVMADAFVWMLIPVAESPIRFPTNAEAWFAILWLGLLGTFVAYILYFSLLQSVGPTKTALVTYVIPVMGLILGVIFLEERIDLRLALGSILIFAGIAVVNWEPRKSRIPSS